jgi:hypothetical protein
MDFYQKKEKIKRPSCGFEIMEVLKLGNREEICCNLLFLNMVFRN